MTADPYTYTPEELQEILRDMDKANQAIYWHMFRAGFGTKCHAFLEFNGLMSKYQQLCAKAASVGIDFTSANIHSSAAVPMEGHDVRYLAEKFECIFGAFFHNNPELAKLFAREALGLDVE
jgi:hypothetical protein